MKKRFWVPTLVLLAAVVVAQERKKGADVPDHEGLAREAHAAMKATTSCGAKGQLQFGQTVYGTVSYSSCIGSISQGTVYIDYWTLDARAGETVKIDGHSSIMYLATIQDDATSAVLASTYTCGFSRDECSFTYPIPQTGRYWVGFGGVNDTGSYRLLATKTVALPPPTTHGPPRTPTRTPTAGPTPTPTVQPACTASYEQLCLNNQRYAVSVKWDTTDGRSGDGLAVQVTPDTGYFYFFDSNNVELCVKVLDGRAYNGHTWFFYGALSNVHYVIKVRDTVTNAEKTYENPQGNMASVADTFAF